MNKDSRFEIRIKTTDKELLKEVAKSLNMSVAKLILTSVHYYCTNVIKKR